MSDLLNAGTAQEQLAKCDAVKPEERKLWESQDVVTGALPHALSEAFQTVEHDFLQTNKVRALVSPCSISAHGLWAYWKTCLLLDICICELSL